MTEDKKKAEVLKLFFASLFTGKMGLRESQVPETRGEIWSKKDVPLVEEDMVREHLSSPDT